MGRQPEREGNNIAAPARGVREAAIGAEAVAGKVLATLNQPYQLGDVAHRCTASVGAPSLKARAGLRIVVLYRTS